MGNVPLIAALISCPVLSVAQAEQLVIVDGKSSDYEIVVAGRTLPTTRLAAQELQDYVKLATGVGLPIVQRPTRGKHQIYIASTDKLKPDGFAIQTQGKNLYLRGRDSPGADRSVDYLTPIHRGTCNAVYEFLERFVGVRWFWSDRLGEIVPDVSSITVPGDDHIGKPPLVRVHRVIGKEPSV